MGREKETLASLHRKCIQDIDESESSIASLQSMIEDLEKQILNEQDHIQLKNLRLEVDKFHKKIHDIQSKRADYLLKNGELLFMHTETEKDKKQKIHGMQILKKKKEYKKNNKESYYYRKYRSNIDPDYVFAPEHNINEDNYCFECKQFKVLHPDEAITICEGCGKCVTVVTNPEKPSMKDPPAENKQYEYKRFTHFCDWLANLQGKESSKVPEEVINAVIREIAREKMQHKVDELNELDIKRYLKKYSNLNYDRYYDHSTQILFRITDIPPLQMTPEMEQNLKLMFLEIQEPFELYKGEHRRNFSSYSYIIYKFCQLLDYNEFLPKLKLHKDKAKLYEHDRIWKKICNHLGGDTRGWKFIKSYEY